MTSFQDPPPPSRRAARQSERSGTAEAEVGVFPAAATDDMWDTTARRAAQLPPATPVAPVVPPAAATGRRAAAPAPQTPASQESLPQPPVAPSPVAQTPPPAVPQALGEPLDYVTQQRPAAPVQPAEPMRRPRGAVSDAGADLPPTQALPKVDQPRYRVRDYSPPAVAPSATPVAQPSQEWTEPYTPDRSLDLDYQTQSRVAPTPVADVTPTLVQPVIPVAEVPAAAVAGAPIDEAPIDEALVDEVLVDEVPESEASVAPAEAPERTLTRREIRALQLKGLAMDATPAAEAAEEPIAQAPIAPEPIALQEPAAPETVSPGTPTGILSSLGFLNETAGIPVVSEPTSAVEAPAPQVPVAVPPLDVAAPVEPAAVVPVAEPADASVESAWPFALVEPSAPQDAAAAAPFPEARDESPLPAVAPEPIADTGLTAALAEFDQLTAEPAAATIEPATFAAPVSAEPVAPLVPAELAAPGEPAQQVAEGPESSPWTPPRGHWSTQLEQEDDFVETTVNRTVGSGATATSSLLLPSIPEASISGPLNGSGEIILTGSIDLPQTFSSTGSSARLEHVGIDKLFESHDAEVVSTESSPVSAVNAISTQSGSGLGAAPKQQGTKALTALIIAAASMGVVVVGLLITAIALNVF